MHEMLLTDALILLTNTEKHAELFFLLSTG